MRPNWLAGDPLRPFGRDDGPAGRRCRHRRYAAWLRRLFRHAVDAAGDLHDRQDALRARALERSGHHRPRAGCRRLWRGRADGQHRRRMPRLCRGLPLLPRRWPLGRPDPRRPLWRLGLFRPRQQDDHHHGDDRTQGGCGQSRRDPRDPRPRFHLCRPIGSCRVHGLHARLRPQMGRCERSDRHDRGPLHQGWCRTGHPCRFDRIRPENARPRLQVHRLSLGLPHAADGL